MKKIEITNETDFRTIMNNANCETTLHRLKRDVEYFKVKIDGKWNKLTIGDFIYIDSNNNITTDK